MLELRSVQQVYKNNEAIGFPDISLPQGEQLLILGPSGSGKSTLLHILAGLLNPTKGSVTLAGHKLNDLSESERDLLRGKDIGIVFQRLHLSPGLTCIDALRAAQYFAGSERDETYLNGLLGRLGLANFKSKYPKKLSVGQAQRLAIARALANKPKVLLADEPTSALDDKHALIVSELLKEHSSACNASLVIATHDARIKEQYSNTLVLQ